MYISQNASNPVVATSYHFRLSCPWIGALLVADFTITLDCDSWQAFTQDDRLHAVEFGHYMT